MFSYDSILILLPFLYEEVQCELKLTGKRIFCFHSFSITMLTLLLHVYLSVHQWMYLLCTTIGSTEASSWTSSSWVSIPIWKFLEVFTIEKLHHGPRPCPFSIKLLKYQSNPKVTEITTYIGRYLRKICSFNGIGTQKVFSSPKAKTNYLLKHPTPGKCFSIMGRSGERERERETVYLTSFSGQSLAFLACSRDWFVSGPKNNKREWRQQKANVRGEMFTVALPTDLTTRNRRRLRSQVP